MNELLLGLRLLLLLTAANSAPIVLKGMLGAQWNTPLDFDRLFPDGRPWFGPSKTWRGLAAAVLVATVLAPLLGFAPEAGALAGTLAMVGDAFSSFVKRRLALPSGAQAFGLDQVPEALLPLLALHAIVDVPWAVLGGVTLLFLLLETPVAWVAHRFHLRERPW